MLMDKRFQPELVASKDPFRYILQYVEVSGEGDKARAVATDGRRLVSVPCTLETNDKPGVVPASVMAKARAAVPRGKEYGFTILRMARRWFGIGPYRDTLIRRERDKNLGTYPKWQVILEDGRKIMKLPPANGLVRLCIAPALLRGLAQAMGKGQEMDGVTMFIHAEDGRVNGGVYVAGLEGSEGVIMPMRDFKPPTVKTS